MNLVSHLAEYQRMKDGDDQPAVRAVLSCPYCAYTIGEVITGVSGKEELQFLLPGHEHVSHVLWRAQGLVAGCCPCCMVSFVWDGHRIIIGDDYEGSVVCGVADLIENIRDGVERGDDIDTIVGDVLGDPDLE
jgi:hypothetical protein